MSAISARCDLVPTNLNYFNAWPFGAIDGKVTNTEMLSQMNTWIVSSPPYEDSMQPFDWRLWDGVPHQGMPNVYDFDWMLYSSPSKISRIAVLKKDIY
jgi:Phospholipase B